MVSASKGVEKAARVRVYRNGEPTTYAAATADGSPEPNTEPFASKDVVTTISHKNFRVGDVDKYTVVIWLDGDDPECVDKIIGGAVEFGFDFDSSETDDSSLFIKFVQDIADTLTGNDPISASGNEAPDYYKEHNVTWSTSVVALTLTRLTGSPSASAIFSAICGRYAASFGRCAMIVASIFSIT